MILDACSIALSKCFEQIQTAFPRILMHWFPKSTLIWLRLRYFFFSAHQSDALERFHFLMGPGPRYKRQKRLIHHLATEHPWPFRNKLLSSLGTLRPWAFLARVQGHPRKYCKSCMVLFIYGLWVYYLLLSLQLPTILWSLNGSHCRLAVLTLTDRRNHHMGMPGDCQQLGIHNVDVSGSSHPRKCGGWFPGINCNYLWCHEDKAECTGTYRWHIVCTSSIFQIQYNNTYSIYSLVYADTSNPW